MPETRYLSFPSNSPPNGGVPPSRIFAEAFNPPNNNSQNNFYMSSLPQGPPPPPYRAPAIGPPPPPFLPPAPAASQMQAPPPPPPATSVSFFSNMALTLPNSLPSHPTPPTAAAYDPPGHYVFGHKLQGPGWTYIAEPSNTTICFVHDGVRPCDSPNGGYPPPPFSYSKHKAPCSMTARTLMKQLGCPEGAPMKGLTEMVALGGDRWAEGDSFTQGGEAGKRTLGEMGWGEGRGDADPVWLVVKR